MSYSGLGYYQQQPPPKPKRTGLWIALSVLGVLVVAGGVVTAVLIGSGSDASAGGPTTTATSAQPEWTTARGSGLTYQVPPSWEESGDGFAGGTRLTGVWVSRPFECQGKQMVQAIVGSAQVTSSSTATLSQIGKAVANNGYTVDGTPPGVSEPVVTEADGRTTVVLAVEPKGVSACYAPKAEITLVAVELPGEEYGVLVLNVAQGGPHVAQGPSDEEADRIVGSVRVS
ncbi:hypothetical protein [Actinosynnema mirum]|uniref:DUF8017 domain-containing protein n=1 Tax=Actinosynnema mirum (strain ATCC 29888 / DSM 43827 / JCM 3225 / NBRC 14064 / NCIMB 13271 / NRRL B-12336 / IMRU 3971 / 101) TaxID=446462 RepID=C6WDL8_ACTMD|nr:hypothetical protein [Actinosynnema mirum]ACU39655.1 hypothetical protein Amir_5845 [Actinosynnema mirum DSM 43827]